MKLIKILYQFFEMVLFAIASIYVINEFIGDSTNLEMGFGLFLLLIFISQIMKTSGAELK